MAKKDNTGKTDERQVMKIYTSSSNASAPKGVERSSSG